MRAWIAGASGLVGSELLRLLLADPGVERVVAVGRRPLAVTHPKLVQWEVSFEAPGTLAGVHDPADVAFACLGTTLAKAGSREAFRAVDLDAVVAFARAARARGARAFLHVTALGADPRARTFYVRVKGEVEEAVARLGFERVVALRPSILDGARAERRPAERAGLVVARALAPVLGRYRPTPAAAVAAAMLELARDPAPGVRAVESREILALHRAGSSASARSAAT